MQYREDKRSGNQLSILGFGCMRLPGGLGRIDRAKSEALLMLACKRGVNYFDTAYLYPGSEEVLGEFIQKHNLRDKVHIATKLPQSLCKTPEDFDRFFEEEKRRLQTGYIDYYLMHNISTFKQWEDLRALGIEDWIAAKKTSGEVRQIGFSYHGSQKDFPLLLEAYDWDFVQIQYNYINIHYQAGVEGLRRAAEKGLPVIIMEPLLGGKLAGGLPKEAMEIMDSAKPGSTPASWGLNWLWNQPEVTVVLSGMNEAGQLEENLDLASQAQAHMFANSDEEAIQKVIGVFNASYRVRCTGCNYCMPCPKNINIPACFSAYNTSYAIGWMSGEMNYVNATGLIGDHPRLASDCVACGQCEKHCPQQIPIRQELKKVRRRFEIPGIRTMAKIARRAMRG